MSSARASWSNPPIHTHKIGLPVRSMMIARNGRCVRRNCRDIVETRLCSSSAMLNVSAHSGSTTSGSQADDLAFRRLDRIPIGLFELASAVCCRYLALADGSDVHLRRCSSFLFACDVSQNQPIRPFKLT